MNSLGICLFKIPLTLLSKVGFVNAKLNLEFWSKKNMCSHIKTIFVSILECRFVGEAYVGFMFGK